VAQPDPSTYRQHAKPERQHGHHGLGREQDATPFQMVCRIPGQRQQQKSRTELQRHHDANRRGVLVRQLRQHQPVLRHALHPGADVRHDGACGPHPVVVTAQ